MTGSSAAIPAGELAAAAAGNKPLLCASNALEMTPASANPSEAHWTTGGLGFTDPDITNQNYPGRRVYDRWLNYASKPTFALSGTFRTYLNFSLDYTGVEWDLLMIAGHNFGSCSAAGVILTVTVADNQDHTVGNTLVTEIGSVGVPYNSNRRILRLSLGLAGNERFSGYAYGRIKIQTADSSDFTAIPQIGEVVFGRRRQLGSRPRIGFAPEQLRSDIAAFESKSGNESTYPRATGQRVVSSDFTADAADALSARTWFGETGNGAKPSLWIENPATSDQYTTTPRPVWCRVPQDLVLPTAGPLHQTWHLDMREISPFASGEG